MVFDSPINSLIRHTSFEPCANLKGGGAELTMFIKKRCRSYEFFYIIEYKISAKMLIVVGDKMN